MSQYNIDSDVLRASPAASAGGSDFQTPERRRGALEQSNTSSSHITLYGTSEQRGASLPGPPQTSTSSGVQEIQGLTQRWESLSDTIKGHAHSSAELLMQQAGMTAQMEDLVRGLLNQLHFREEEKHRLEVQVLQDRADFTSQAKLLSQHFTLSHHRNTALQVAHESLQGDMKTLHERLDREAKEAFSLRQQLAVVQKEASEMRSPRKGI